MFLNPHKNHDKNFTKRVFFEKFQEPSGDLNYQQSERLQGRSQGCIEGQKKDNRDDDSNDNEGESGKGQNIQKLISGKRSTL